MIVNLTCAAVLSLALAAPTAGWSTMQQNDDLLTIRTRSSRVVTKAGNDPLRMPTDVAVGSDGRVYVVDGVRHRVVVFDSQGAVRSTFGGLGAGRGELRYPLGIAAGPGGSVYVADTGNRRVQEFGAEGDVLDVIRVPTESGEREPDISDVAFDPGENRLYMVDNDNHKILVYDLTTRSFLKAWGKPGRARLQFRYPFLMTVSPDGYVLVTETINTRVQVMNSRGDFVSYVGSWGVEPGQIFRPKGVAVLDGQVFVSDGYLGTVQVYTLRGRFLGVLSDSNGKPLEFVTPTGIAVDPELERVYVVELKANQVRYIDLR